MALLRHDGMGRIFTRAYAPSTLGSFLRAFTFGHVRPLDAVASRCLTRLADQAPLGVGESEVVLVDVDDTVIEVHGYAKQAAGFGYSGVRGLNALLASAAAPRVSSGIVAQRRARGVWFTARRQTLGGRSAGDPRRVGLWMTASFHRLPDAEGRCRSPRDDPVPVMIAEGLTGCSQRRLGADRAVPTWGHWLTGPMPVTQRRGQEDPRQPPVHGRDPAHGGVARVPGTVGQPMLSRGLGSEARCRLILLPLAGGLWAS